MNRDTNSRTYQATWNTKPEGCASTRYEVNDSYNIVTVSAEPSLHTWKAFNLLLHCISQTDHPNYAPTRFRNTVILKRTQTYLDVAINFPSGENCTCFTNA